MKKTQTNLEVWIAGIDKISNILKGMTPAQIREELDAMTQDERNETLSTMQQFREKCQILAERLGGSIPTKWKD